MNNQGLMLYYSPYCQYCIRVRRFMSQNDISVPEKDISRDSNARRELIEAGGKGQVPALMIDGQVLYESNDIIQWFKQNVLETGEAV